MTTYDMYVMWNEVLSEYPALLKLTPVWSTGWSPEVMGNWMGLSVRVGERAFFVKETISLHEFERSFFGQHVWMYSTARKLARELASTVENEIERAKANRPRHGLVGGLRRAAGWLSV